MRTFLVISLLVTGFLTFGCSSARLTPVRGPDGQEWVAIACSHGAKNCWQAAADFCPLGYETADEVQSTHGFLFMKHSRDEMLVHCVSPQSAAKVEHVVPVAPPG